MNLPKYIIFFSILIFFQIGCTSDINKNSESELSDREKLYKEVMKIHDDVMPKMSDINRVKRNLKDQLEEGKIVNDQMKQKINASIDELIAAEDSMMDWMREFKAPKDADPDEKVIKYLNEEKLKISRVSDQMLSSLQNGSNILDQLKKNHAYQSEK